MPMEKQFFQVKFDNEYDIIINEIDSLIMKKANHGLKLTMEKYIEVEIAVLVAVVAVVVVVVVVAAVVVVIVVIVM